MKSNKVILFNPRSAWSKYPIINSILGLGAALEGKYDYVFVGDNREKALRIFWEINYLFEIQEIKTTSEPNQSQKTIESNNYLKSEEK